MLFDEARVLIVLLSLPHEGSRQLWKDVAEAVADIVGHPDVAERRIEVSMTRVTHDGVRWVVAHGSPGDARRAEVVVAERVARARLGVVQLVAHDASDAEFLAEIVERARFTH